MLKKIAIVFFILTYPACNSNNKKTDQSKIEVYLIKKRKSYRKNIGIPLEQLGEFKEYLVKHPTYRDRRLFLYDTLRKTLINAGEFIVQIEDLDSIPIIKDNEILSYNPTSFEFEFSESACLKLRNIEGNLANGSQFALTVDKRIVLTGYIWSTLSSFGSQWYTIIDICDGKVYKGIPENDYKNLKELRNNTILLRALRESNRLQKNP